MARRRVDTICGVALLLSPVLAHAQAAVEVCMPEAPAELREALALELRARGHTVSVAEHEVGATIECGPSAGWVLTLEVPDPLADVWVEARGPEGEVRRARVGGPLDTLDVRAVALTAASLLDEQDLTRPDPAELTDSVEAPANEPPPPAASTPPAGALEADATAGPVELVESTRAIGASWMIELGVLGGLVTHEQWRFGIRAGLGVHLAPWLRWRALVSASFVAEVLEMNIGFGPDVVLALARGESWLELGLAMRFAPLFAEGNVIYQLGPSANVALFYAVSDAWRLFLRAEGMPLFDVQGSSDPGYGLYLSAGAAVFP